MIDAPTPYRYPLPLTPNPPPYTSYPNTPSFFTPYLFILPGTTIMIDARPGDASLTFQSIIDVKPSALSTEPGASSVTVADSTTTPDIVDSNAILQ